MEFWKAKLVEISEPAPERTRVFVSYSRKDIAFADALRAALQRSGFEVHIDQHDILPGEPWKERLHGLISVADTVVFCLSPDFVASEICSWEVSEAQRLGKRMLPVVIDQRLSGETHAALKRLNFVFVAGLDHLEGQLPTIISALETDVDWIREHTRLGEQAAIWTKGNRHNDLLLSRTELAVARRWLTREPPPRPQTMHPKPTEEILGLIEASVQRHRRTSRLRFAAIISALVVGCAAAFAYHDYTTEKTHYYARMDVAPLVPRFAAPLTLKSDVPLPRNEIYRVTSARYRTTGYSCVTSFGLPQLCRGQAHSALIITYTDAGPAKFEWLDLRGRIVRSMTYSPDDHVAVLENKSVVEIDKCLVGQTLWSDPVWRTTNVARFRFTLDADGRRREVHYLNGYGLPTLDGNGSAGVRYEYDGAGRVISETSLGRKYQPSPDNNGRLTIATVYDGARVTTRHLGLGGQPINGPQEHHRIVRTFDGHGNLIQERTFNRQDAPYGNRCNPAATETRWTYDERGQRLSERYFDEWGQPFGLGFSQRIGFAYGYGEPSPTTQTITTRELLMREAPAKPGSENTSDAISLLQSKLALPMTIDHFDVEARQSARSFFAADGNPQLNKDGVHKIVENWSADGSSLEEATFDIAGKPVASDQGYARKRITRNDRGVVTRIEHYGVEGRLVRNEDGYAVAEHSVNASGQTEAEQYLDEQLKPVAIQTGYSRIEYRYNQLGLLASRKYFGLSGEPVENQNGHHETRWLFSEAGQETRITDFRADRTLVNDLDLLFDYDENGRDTRRSFLDGRGKPRKGPCKEGLGAFEIALSHRATQDKPYRELLDPLELIREFAEGRTWGSPSHCTEVTKTYHLEGVLKSITFAPSPDTKGAEYLATTMRTVVDANGYITMIEVVTPDGLPAYSDLYPPKFRFSYDGARLAAVELVYSELAKAKAVKMVMSVGAHAVELEDRLVRFAYGPSGALESEAVLDPKGRPSSLSSHRPAPWRSGWHKRVYRVGGIPAESVTAFDTQGFPVPDGTWEDNGANLRQGIKLPEAAHLDVGGPHVNTTLQSERYCMWKRWIPDWKKWAETWIVPPRQPRDLAGFADQCDTRRFLSFRRLIDDAKQETQQRFTAGLRDLKPGERIRAFAYLERRDGYCGRGYIPLRNIQVLLVVPTAIRSTGEAASATTLAARVVLDGGMELDAHGVLSGQFNDLRLISSEMLQDPGAEQRLRQLCGPAAKIEHPDYKRYKLLVRRESSNSAFVGYVANVPVLHAAPYGVTAIAFDFEVR